MAHVLPARESASSKFGSGLGQGFSATMQAVAQNKLQQMFDQQQSQRLYKTLAPVIGEEQAKFASSLPAAERSLFLQNPNLNFNFGGQQGQAQQQNQQGVLPQSLQQGAQQPQQNESLQRVLQQLQSPGGAAQLLARTGLGMEQQQPVQNQPIAQQQMQQAIQQQPQQNVPQQPQGQVIKGALAKRSPEAEERVQNAIETRNEPFNSLRRTQRAYAKTLEPLLKEVRSYDKEGKLREGITGFAPGFTLNSEEQRANEIFTKIATLKDSSEGSVRSNYQTLLKQAMKPALWKDKKTRELAYEELQRIVDDIKLEDEIAEDLIIKNNNRQPRNFETLVEKKVDAIQAKRATLPKSGDEGDILVDGRTGFPEWQYVGDSWKWVGGV